MRGFDFQSEKRIFLLDIKCIKCVAFAMCLNNDYSNILLKCSIAKKNVLNFMYRNKNEKISTLIYIFDSLRLPYVICINDINVKFQMLIDPMEFKGKYEERTYSAVWSSFVISENITPLNTNEKTLDKMLKYYLEGFGIENDKTVKEMLRSSEKIG